MERRASEKIDSIHLNSYTFIWFSAIAWIAMSFPRMTEGPIVDPVCDPICSFQRRQLLPVKIACLTNCVRAPDPIEQIDI